LAGFCRKFKEKGEKSYVGGNILGGNALVWGGRCGKWQHPPLRFIQGARETLQGQF